MYTLCFSQIRRIQELLNGLIVYVTFGEGDVSKQRVLGEHVGREDKHVRRN